MRILAVMVLVGALNAGIAEATRLRLSSIGKGIVPRTLLAAATVGSLLALPLNVNSAPQPVVHHDDNAWERLDHGHHADHHSAIFYLVLRNGENIRHIPLVYLGTDPEGSALLMGLRLGITSLPHQKGISILGASDIWLLDNHGVVVWQNDTMELEEVQKFISPDQTAVRLYDLTLLMPHGFEPSHYHAAEIAATLPHAGDPLHTIAWHGEQPTLDWLADLDRGIVARIQLMQRNCAAGMPGDGAWAATNTCSAGVIDPAMSSPTFNMDGQLVGFNLSRGDGVAIAASVADGVHELLSSAPHSVDAGQKLPTKWGAIKQGSH